MRIDGLHWDVRNIEHIERHRVEPDEVEEVCLADHDVVKTSKARFIVSGQAGSGRYLHIILDRIQGSYFRPITAFEMTEHQKSAYRKRNKR